jgi:DNA-binding NarL/FixJ family response regulator
VRILVCDDHMVVRAGLRGLLSEEPDFELVGEASDGEEAVRLADRLKPDVVLMDLRMPVMDGATAIGRIKADHPEVHAIVLTTYETDLDILKAVENGATGYVLKNAPREELFQAIRNAAEGKPLLSPAITARLMQRMRDPSEEALSRREIEVLKLVSRGISNKDIAKELWISETTVKTHMVHVFEKLGVTDRTAAVTVALKRGILSLDDQ